MRTTQESRPGTDTPSREHAPRWRAVADHWLLALGLAALCTTLMRLRSGVDDDAWLHVRIGHELRSGEWFHDLPDPLVTLADRAYLPTQWLSEVVGSVAFDTSGVVGLRALRAVALLVVFAAAYATARPTMSPGRATGMLLLLAFTTSAAWAERPQLAGLALGAVTVLLWSRTMADGRARWLLVPVTWVWAMVHGTWAVGLAIGGAFVVATFVARPRTTSWSRVGGCLVASAAVVAATPLGPRLLVEPFAVSSHARAGVNEWQPPTWQNPLYVLVLAVALVAVVRALLRRPADLAAVVLAVSGAALAAYSVRTVAFGALFLVPALARTFPSRRPPPVGVRELVPLAVAAALVVAVPGAVWGGPSSGPVAATVDEALDALPPGSAVAVDVRVSGWVLADHPDLRPLRDLRAESYSEPTAAAYESFAHGAPGWKAYAEGHGVDAILTARGSALDEELAASGAWVSDAAGSMYRLWVRR